MKSIKIYLITVVLLAFIAAGCSNNNTESDISENKGASHKNDDLINFEFNSIYLDFNMMFIQYKLGLIDKEGTVEKIKSLLERTGEYYNSRTDKPYSFSDWVFPVQGYGPEVIGGKNGSGFIAGNFDFFDRNGLNGHPAHDIFIHDKDRDDMDDRTGKPVNVLSMSGGVVISVQEEWTENDSSKGGKYIWVFDPVTESIFYYAHNRAIFVEPGDVLKPGDIIAEIGRTGENAFESRSPTHLHLGMFKIENGVPKPHNYYKELAASRLVN
jgi:hypothetical protein